MATMKIVCGDCGGSLSPEDTSCPQCGSLVERPELRGAAEGSSGRCPACGHRNSRSGLFCESCGIRLGAAGRTSEQKRKLKGVQTSVHVPVIVFAILFGGWGLYDDLSRDIPSVPDHDHASAASGTQEHSELLTQIRQLQRMVEAHPDDDAMLLRLANLLQDYSREDHQSLHLATETYERYLQRNPDDENARVDLGICYFDLARHDSTEAHTLLQRAITEMKSVAQKNPKHQAAAFNLGIVMLNAGNTAESGEWFRRAAAIDPGSNLGQRAGRLLEEHTFAE